MTTRSDLIDDMLNIPIDKWERWLGEKAAAQEFANRVLKYCGIKLEAAKWNEDDPPDCWIWLDGQKIGLEVIRLSDPHMVKKNIFFKRLDKIAQEICNKYKDLLPKGSYFHFFTPTLNNKISSISLKKILDETIPGFFKNFSKQDRKLAIKDKNQEIGYLSFSKMTDNLDGVNFISFPQEIFRMEKFNKNQFETFIELLLTKKERFSKEGTWWLLISDLDGLSYPSMVDFNLSDTTIQSNIFKRAFIIKSDYKDYPITEIKVINPKNLN